MANKEKMVIQKPEGVFPETVGWSTGSVLFRISVNSNSTKTKQNVHCIEHKEVVIDHDKSRFNEMVGAKTSQMERTNEEVETTFFQEIRL